ncbi:MAG TPA: choice-of-anchor Q domain-containing protein [Methylomirabilota bacterium]|nr:choice-of-anchor Q domain-containing protein [Methylomirabilota bacterium]
MGLDGKLRPKHSDDVIQPGTSNISYTLNNLRPNQSNHFRLVVVYSAGATYGGDIGFTTLLTRPVVATGRPLAVSYTNTTLWGTVDTFDAPANVYFEWGTTTNYGNTTTPTVLNTSGSAWATTQIAGLSSNTVYHYRLIASNSVGISTGNDFSFGTEGSLFYGSVLRDAIAAGGTITFSEDGIASPAPLFEITNNVTLDANGHQVTLSGGRFIVRPGVELTLIGLTIQNVGFQNPGGESVGGAIVLDNATLRATNCAFINNRTVGGPGTYHPDGGGKDAKGGAIAAVNSTVQIVGCFFSGNNVEGGYGVSRGPFHFPPDGRSLGGAIWALGGSLSISGSLFHSNTAWKGFAPFFSTSALCAGGALYVQSNAVEISSSVFYDNAAFWNGGAIYSSGLFGMTNSTFAGNWSQSEGTAVLLTNGVSSISHCTIASNSFPNPTIGASVGPALANRSGTLSIFGSILAGNAAGNSVGVITDLGHNLSSDATPVWTSGTGLNNTDPLLGPLSDNGGFTFTFPLLPGSPAIDAANPLTAPTADQRGVSRPQGPAPDIGSFERQ